MNIPFVDLSRQSKNLKKQIAVNIKNVTNSADFILGKELSLFEKAFAKYIGTKYCIGVASGTDALLLSLIALGIKEGDEVIVPAMTYSASVSPVVRLRATPILIDISKDTAQIAEEKIEKAITKKTKAIMPVHFYGSMPNMDAIAKIAKKHNLFIIEDACQAHGSLYKQKKAGSLGTIAAFSFYPGKNLGAFGDGGAIVTSKKDLYEKILLLRHHGQKEKNVSQIVGYNSRLDTIQAAVLNAKLSFLDSDNSKRRQAAKLYNSLLKDLPIKLPLNEKNVLPNYHVFAIQTDKRDELFNFLKKEGISCNIHYPLPIHLHPAFSVLNYKKNDFPNAENLAKTGISLPMFAGIKKEEIIFVSKKLHEFFNSSNKVKKSVANN